MLKYLQQIVIIFLLITKKGTSSSQTILTIIQSLPREDNNKTLKSFHKTQYVPILHHSFVRRLVRAQKPHITQRISFPLQIWKQFIRTQFSHILNTVSPHGTTATNNLKIRSKDSSHVLLEFLQLLLYYDIHSIDLIDSLSWETLDDRQRYAKSIFMFHNIK